MTFTESFKVRATAPFDFDLSAQIFGNGDKQIRTYQSGVFSQVIKLDSQLALVKISADGKVETPNLVVEMSQIILLRLKTS